MPDDYMGEVAYRDPYDAYLLDAATGGSVELGLIFARDPKNERPSIREFRAPPLPPKQSEGALTWTNRDPLNDLTFAQTDWSGGGLRPYHKTGDNKYARANGVDARWEGVLALGMLSSQQLSILVPNPSWETGALSGWTSNAGSLGSNATVVTTAPRSGTYHLQIPRTNGETQVSCSYTVPNPTNLRGRSITFFAYVRAASGSKLSSIQVVETGPGTTTKTDLNVGTTYTYTSVTVTISATTTAINLYLVAGEATATFYWDDHGFFISAADTCVGMVEAGGAWYAAVGPMVLKWNESNQFWALFACDSAGTAATDIISFNNYIYVAYGLNQSYKYGEIVSTITATTIAFVDGGAGDDTITDSGNGFVAAGFQANDSITITGSASNNYTAIIKSVVAGTITVITATTTTEAAGASVTIATPLKLMPSTRTAPSDKAQFFAKRRNQLWKNETAQTVGNTTNGANGSTAWSTLLTVGSTSSDITGMYGVFDTIVVGKEDGLHIYDEVFNTPITGLFANITNEYENDPQTENFQRGEVWKGDLYTSTARQGLLRYDGANFEDLSELFMAPRFGEYSGRVRAMAADPFQLWLLVDTNVADATATKTTRLMSLRKVDGKWQLHPMQNITIGDINALGINGGYLYAMGRLQHAGTGGFVISSYRWLLPSKSPAPFADGTPSIAASGTFDTSIWHADAPDTPKAYTAIDVWHSRNLDTNHTIALGFAIDGGTTYTALTTLSTNPTAPRAVSTVYLHTLVTTPATNAVGRSIQLQLTLASNNTVSPEVYGIAIHATLRPERLRTWEVWLDWTEMMKNGQDNPAALSTFKTNLRTLELQTYPVIFRYDIDKDGDTDDMTVQIYPGTPEMITDESGQETREVVRLLLQEVLTATPA